jgi:pSer/pThr/pTyr-binding forkhead associated (FHA) protein
MYDLGSLNGIGINGRMTRGPVVLQNGDTVGVGNHDFIFQRK